MGTCLILTVRSSTHKVTCNRWSCAPCSVRPESSLAFRFLSLLPLLSCGNSQKVQDVWTWWTCSKKWKTRLHKTDGTWWNIDEHCATRCNYIDSHSTTQWCGVAMETLGSFLSGAGLGDAAPMKAGLGDTAPKKAGLGEAPNTARGSSCRKGTNLMRLPIVPSQGLIGPMLGTSSDIVAGVLGGFWAGPMQVGKTEIKESIKTNRYWTVGQHADPKKKHSDLSQGNPRKQVPKSRLQLLSLLLSLIFLFLFVLFVLLVLLVLLFFFSRLSFFSSLCGFSPFSRLPRLSWTRAMAWVRLGRRGVWESFQISSRFWWTQMFLSATMYHQVYWGKTYLAGHSIILSPCLLPFRCLLHCRWSMSIFRQQRSRARGRPKQIQSRRFLPAKLRF